MDILALVLGQQDKLGPVRFGEFHEIDPQFHQIDFKNERALRQIRCGSNFIKSTKFDLYKIRLSALFYKSTSRGYFIKLPRNFALN